MTIPFGHISVRARTFIVALVVIALSLGTVAAAGAADPRLEKAQARKDEIQQRLNALTEDMEATRSRVESTEAELRELRAQGEEQRDEASAADRLRTHRVRESYKRGNSDPVLGLLTAEDPTDAIEQARFMAWLSAETQEDFEEASASAVRTASLADHTAETVERLRAEEQDLSDQQAEVERLFDEAVAAEETVRELIENERAAARATAARRAAAADSAASRSTAAAPVNGGVACPVGGPRSYVDSWGAARSGGRRHVGTDILAPRGTPTNAYEDGVITRMSSNSLGGISLYLQGDSGNLYYYTHLSGYASLSVGQRVSAGQVVAYVGATGNARGINHLHFEVRPGGGGNVNPYPYVLRACG